MYNTIKLDKSLYKISGKSFSQVLSELDPDCSYEGTELSGLDAFERQLKRFNIRISGKDCDVVDKFFTSSESAVLFPEFVKRAVTAGIESAFLSDIVAVNTSSITTDYRGFSVMLVNGIPYSMTSGENTSLPQTFIGESDSVTLLKYGRLISTSYEALRFQKLDLFACTLKSVGAQLGNELSKKALTVLTTNSITVAGTSGGFVFADLLSLYRQFTSYDLTTLIASPATCASLLALSELEDAKSDDGGLSVKLPFGPTLYKAKAYTGTGIIGIDRNYALEMITNGGICIETDKLIDKQVETVAVTIRANFRKILTDAVRVLTYTT